MDEKKRLLKILLFGLLSLSILGCSVTGLTDGGESTYSISGKVTGAVLADVTINLTGTASASTTTNASGEFSFSSLSNGAYTIMPVKEGFTFTPSSFGTDLKGSNITGVNFVATTATPAIIYVPGAVFHPGSPPAPSGNSPALEVTNSTPSGPLSVNTTIIWTVTWTVTTVTVEYVDLYVEDLGGYFEYEVETPEALAGEAQIEMVESFSFPPDEPCIPRCPKCTCYVKAPEATTDAMKASVNLVGDSGDIGVTYLGGAGLTLGEVCGNAVCASGENSFSCPGDCPAVCGNGICEGGENASTCASDCNKTEVPTELPAELPSDLPTGFPSDIPSGTYLMTCGQYSQTIVNDNISQFAEQLVSQTQSALQGASAACNGSGCTCNPSFTYTPWNGTSFTMTLVIAVTCCGGGQCATFNTPVSCMITAE